MGACLAGAGVELSVDIGGVDIGDWISELVFDIKVAFSLLALEGAGLTGGLLWYMVSRGCVSFLGGGDGGGSFFGVSLVD